MIFENTSGRKEIIPACPVCGAQGTKPLCEADGYCILRCPECASDFVWPMPDNRTLKILYDREKWFEGGEKGGYQNYDMQTENTLPFFNDFLNEYEKTCSGRSILDIGCGYGTHLSIARKRGWKCFGVEPSEHARRIIKQRYGGEFFVVEGTEDLIPHEFDVILLFDVIEHLRDPYRLFFSLFSKGAVGAKTHILLTTPNARSYEAVANPDKWIYRHPPSHLIYYSGESLLRFFTRLHFSDIKISGSNPQPAREKASYNDESSSLNRTLDEYSGIICKAQGSDFTAFMHERYVPGTWSKIAEYEHMPRYIFAQKMVAGVRVLDFGCGTGYGSALLAEKAESVTGVDIDESALQWAAQTHKNPRLRFEQVSDLGEILPDHEFDIITCFEVIEHVDHHNQMELIKNFARLLTADGKLLISTPNPEVTSNYGPNPFHLREMNETEFRQLLQRHFSHITIMRQWIRPSVVISPEPLPLLAPDSFCTVQHGDGNTGDSLALAYIAICSNKEKIVIPPLCCFDFSSDYIAEAMSIDKKLVKAHLENYEKFELLAFQESRLQEQEGRLQEQEGRLQEQEGRLQEQEGRLQEQEGRLQEQEGRLQEQEGRLQEQEGRLQEQEGRLKEISQEILTYKKLKLDSLKVTLQQEQSSIRKFAKILKFFIVMAFPRAESKIQSMKRIIRIIRNLFTRVAPSQGAAKPYHVQPLHPLKENRPRVVHILANFMIGGSSRLVVDLVEHLGHLYEQEIITSYNPNPPGYTGVSVHEYKLHRAEEVITYLTKYRPTIVHIHYWGDVDKQWYQKMFDAAEKYGCKTIENINTPVEPHESKSISKYVYVSNYVHTMFGRHHDNDIVIYPGSNFARFTRLNNPDIPDNCVGMVYRLETDKLNEHAIEVFIKVAQRRPETKMLIVGGGTFLPVYRQAALAAGVIDSFEFTDYVPYNDLPALYERMSIFVAPVWKESFGQVSPFAMNMGIPVVGYDVGALAEIIGSNELLAKPGDSDQLADIIIGLLDDRRKRLSIGEKNKERAQKLFTVETMIEEYRKLYDDLLKDAG